MAYCGDGTMNLNNVETPGLYYAYNASSNLPVSGIGGMLIVTSGGGGALITQLFINNNGLTRWRACDHGTWSAWHAPQLS